jgi:hypothetical protein
MADVHKVVEQTKMQHAIKYAGTSYIRQKEPSSKETP